MTAEAFRRLHHDGLLVLPNAWDAGTARLVEHLGAKAVATTSAAVAWSHGYPDGDLLPVPLLVAAVAEIARVVSVPISVDLEGGDADDPAAVAATIAAVVDAGAVGINIEDGVGPPDRLAAKIGAAKGAAARLGVDLFVNARTDVYLRGLGPTDRRLAETLARADRYRAAGADGVFVPGLAEPAAIRAIAAAVPLPLNVLAQPGLSPASALAALDVRRLSADSGIAQAVYGRAAALAAAFLRRLPPRRRLRSADRRRHALRRDQRPRRPPLSVGATARTPSTRDVFGDRRVAATSRRVRSSVVSARAVRCSPRGLRPPEPHSTTVAGGLRRQRP